MRGARTIILLFAVVVAGASWWGFSGSALQPANAVELSAGDCQSGAGTKSPDGKAVTYPAGTKCFKLYWQTTGSGESASGLRDCSVTGNNTKLNVGVLATTTLRGDATFFVKDGDKLQFTISCKSKVVGENTDAAGKPLKAIESIGVEIASPICTGGDCGGKKEGCDPKDPKKNCTLPGTVSPPKPEYREL